MSLLKLTIVSDVSKFLPRVLGSTDGSLALPSLCICADRATASWSAAPHINMAEVCLITEPNMSRCCLMLLLPQRSSCLLPQRSQGVSTSLEALHLLRGEWWRHINDRHSLQWSQPISIKLVDDAVMKARLCFSVCIAYVSLGVAPSTTSQNYPLRGTHASGGENGIVSIDAFTTLFCCVTFIIIIRWSIFTISLKLLHLF